MWSGMKTSGKKLAESLCKENFLVSMIFAMNDCHESASWYTIHDPYVTCGHIHVQQKLSAISSYVSWYYIIQETRLYINVTIHYVNIYLEYKCLICLKHCLECVKAHYSVSIKSIPR